MAETQFKRDPDGLFICPHNSECRCTSTNCASCCWHPDVRKTRLEALAKKYGVSETELHKILHNERSTR